MSSLGARDLSERGAGARPRRWPLVLGSSHMSLKWGDGVNMCAGSCERYDRYYRYYCYYRTQP